MIEACETPNSSARGPKLKFTIKLIAAELSVLDVYEFMHLKEDEFF